jgi:ABC-type nickel/cobalt efflux system permease component RcnA
MLENFSSMSSLAVVAVGLVFGLKHATEVDHVIAVSTIVSQHRSLFRSALIGALWGLGHTAALMITGLIVLTLRIAIPAKVSSWFEFAVALMIIFLGASGLWRSLRKRTDMHLHRHSHDGVSHVHLHFHEKPNGHSLRGFAQRHIHAVSGIGFKPVLVGTIHGLAGSGALTLLVLTQIKSTVVGLFYLGIFGVGSIAGMLLMSGLIGLPFALSSHRLSGVPHRLQMVAAGFSIVFGLWYAYQVLSLGS